MMAHRSLTFEAPIPFPKTRRDLGVLLLEAPEVKVPEWQSMDVVDKPMGVTHELQNVMIECAIPDELLFHKPEFPGVNFDWAEEHFQERVSGIPYNPPPSHVNWPFAQKNNEGVMSEEQFSHTYPERMWPKHAGEGMGLDVNYGIRFNYGDLRDVVDQLRKSPLTRQAYLPIWFPEDTGAVHGERVPCTLGYHFLIREGRLNVTYFIRSCDFLRHFPDDVYMAMRLGQWMRDRLRDGSSRRPILETGTLTMHMISLHVFGGDMPRMRNEFA